MWVIITTGFQNYDFLLVPNMCNNIKECPSMYVFGLWNHHNQWIYLFRVMNWNLRRFDSFVPWLTDWLTLLVYKPPVVNTTWGRVLTLATDPAYFGPFDKEIPRLSTYIKGYIHETIGLCPPNDIWGVFFSKDSKQKHIYLLTSYLILFNFIMYNVLLFEQAEKYMQTVFL